LPAFSLSAITVLATSSYGQTNRNWNGTTSTVWGTSQNWTGTGAQADRVPDTAGEVAVFASATLNDPASYGTALTIGGFSLTGGEARSLVFTNTISLDQYGVDNSSALNLSITGAGTTTLSAAQTWSVSNIGNTEFGKTIANGGFLLTLDGSNSGTGTINSQIGGSGGITKNGTGTWTLSGQNAYSGNTTLNAGTLFANNTSGSATGTGAVSVGASGKLAGTGTITPSGTNGINVTGVLAPGGSVGTGNLTLNLGGTTGTVTMNSAAGADFEFLLGIGGLNITSLGTSDLLTIAGAATSDFAFNGNEVDFLSSGAIGFYKLFDTSIDNANTWTGLTYDSGTGVVSSGLTYSNLASGLSGTFIVGTAGNGGTTGDIYFQVVPEPGASLLGGLGTLLLLRRRRVA
jgi:autotransporter-associated beta strand protein